jgi:uncharacterized membrane protein (DUF4010 family)
VRTFTLLGLLGGLCGLLGAEGLPVAGGAMAAAAAAVLTIGYARRTGADKRDATTPIASLVTLALAVLAGSGNPGLAIAGATLATAVLALRTESHALIDRLDEDDVKALARYAVIAGAVLPFLPSGNYGPLGAWNPRYLWLVVVIVTGFSFLGYAANRIFGERHGTIATAVIGGLYSSTAVTQSLAQRLGRTQVAGAEPAGIALASAVMYVRVLILVGIVATRILLPFAAILLPAIVVGVGAGWWLYRKSPRSDAPTPPGNPIALVPALGFVIFVAAMAVAVAWSEGRFGQQGIALLLLISGSANVDVAIVTAGGLPPTAISAELAAIALAGTIVANMMVKIGVTIVYARSKGKSAAIALIASTLVLAASIAVAWVTMI